MPLETLLSPRFKTSLALIGPPVVGRTDPIGLIEVRVTVQTLRLNSFQLPTNQTREIKGKNLQSPSLLGVVTEALTQTSRGSDTAAAEEADTVSVLPRSVFRRERPELLSGDKV